MKNLFWLIVSVLLAASSCVKTPDPWKPDALSSQDGAGAMDNATGDVGTLEALLVDTGIEDALAEAQDVTPPPDSEVEELLEVTDLLPELTDLSPEDVPVADAELEDLQPDGPAEILDLTSEEMVPEVVCQEDCQAGTQMCVEGTPAVCELDESDCPAWVLGEACPANQFCEVLEDVAQCQWDCEAVCTGKCDDGGTDGICECDPCDDDNPCTMDGCDAETDLCAFDSAAFDGVNCNADGDGCTAGDACMDGQCVAGVLVDCSQLNGDCVLGTCVTVDESAYTCDPQPAPAGTACDDGNFCTLGEACTDDGLCTGGQANTCWLEAEPCQEITCNPFTETCKPQPLPDGEACDDDDVCTTLDICDGGACIGTMSVCLPRQVSTASSHTGELSLSGPPGLAYLGFDRALATWRAGGNRIAGRFINGELSLSYPELTLLDGWDPEPADCDVLIGKSTVVSRSNGDFLLVTSQLSARVWRTLDSYQCDAAWVARYSMAAFDRDGLPLAAPQSFGDAPVLWYDFKKSSGGQIQDYECGCDKYPNKFAPWLDISFPTAGSLSGGGINAMAYGDGSFGIAYWDETAVSGHYLPVSALFEALPALDLGAAVDVQGCVSAEADVALLVYGDGQGGVAGRFLDHEQNDLLGNPFPISTLGAGMLTRPTCAGLPDGSFVVTNSECDGLYDCDTTLQLVDAGGGLADDDVQLHVDDTGEQLPVAGPVAFPDGRYVVIYHDDPFGGLASQVKSRTYAGALLPEGAAAKLSLNENVPNSHPVGKLVAGDLVVGWLRQYLGETDVVFRKVDVDGMPVFGAPEHRGNSVVTGAQGAGAGVELPGANYALVWQSESMSGGIDHDIALRIFAADGSPLGPETLANATIVGDQMDPGVAYHAATDSLLITWTHRNLDLSRDIKGRLFTSAGAAKSDEFQVSFMAQAPEDEYRSVPLFLDDGSFIVNHTGWSSPGYLEDIFAQAFANDGTPLFTPGKVRVNYQRMDRQDHVAAVAVGGQSYVAVSAQYSESNWTPLNVTVRKLTLSVDGESGLYTLLGVPDKGDILITNGGYPEDPAIAFDGSNLLVCWKALPSVNCQALTLDLQFAGAAFTVENLGYPEFPTLAARESNHFLLAYDQLAANGDGDLRGVVLHQLDGTGKALDPAVLANWTLTGDQSDPFVVPVSLAELMVVGWTSNGQDGDGDGIVFRVLE